MAKKKATKPAAPASMATGTKYPLWIDSRSGVSVILDWQCPDAPPTAEHCDRLNEMCQGLARALTSVLFQAENDEKSGGLEALKQPIEGITNTIILLSQLSENLRSEIRKAKP